MQILVNAINEFLSTFKNKVNSLNTKIKRWYFATRISKCKGNMQETWNTRNQLFNKRSKSTNIDLRDQNKSISN